MLQVMFESNMCCGGGGNPTKKVESSKRLGVPVEVVKTVILNKSVRIWFLGKVWFKQRSEGLNQAYI